MIFLYYFVLAGLINVGHGINHIDKLMENLPDAAKILFPPALLSFLLVFGAFAMGWIALPIYFYVFLKRNL